MKIEKINARKRKLRSARARRLISRMPKNTQNTDQILTIIVDIAAKGLWREWGYACLEDYLVAEMNIKGPTLKNIVKLLKQKGIYHGNTNN